MRTAIHRIYRVIYGNIHCKDSKSGNNSNTDQGKPGGDWLHKWWCTHAMEYYTAIKETEATSSHTYREQPLRCIVQCSKQIAGTMWVKKEKN